MLANVGSIERAIRIVAGLGIISLAFWGPQTKWAALGALPLATGLLGWCPLYSILGISTCRKKTRT